MVGIGVRAALHWWISQYNEDHPHPAIGYRTPRQFEASFELQPSTQKTQQIAHYQQALRINPDFTPAQNALARLQAGQ